jgi:hypothetical protein
VSTGGRLKEVAYLLEDFAIELMVPLFVRTCSSCIGSDKGDLRLELSNSLQISSRELERMGIN